MNDSFFDTPDSARRISIPAAMAAMASWILRKSSGRKVIDFPSGLFDKTIPSVLNFSVRTPSLVT